MTIEVEVRSQKLEVRTRHAPTSTSDFHFELVSECPDGPLLTKHVREPNSYTLDFYIRSRAATRR